MNGIIRKNGNGGYLMRKYVIGAIVGFCLSIGVGAHAEVSSLVGRVIEGVFPVTYNAAPIGDALVLDGTTYLPVRKLGEAMGLNVAFDADLGVSLTKTVSETTYAIPQEVKPVVTTPVDNSKKIQEIDVKIKSIQNEIPTYEQLIDGHKRNNRPYEQTENSLAKLRETITDLEKQKAELSK